MLHSFSYSVGNGHEFGCTWRCCVGAENDTIRRIGMTSSKRNVSVPQNTLGLIARIGTGIGSIRRRTRKQGGPDQKGHPAPYYHSVD
jgi:hypothetical protein